MGVGGSALQLAAPAGGGAVGSGATTGDRATAAKGGSAATAGGTAGGCSGAEGGGSAAAGATSTEVAAGGGGGGGEERASMRVASAGPPRVIAAVGARVDTLGVPMLIATDVGASGALACTLAGGAVVRRCGCCRAETLAAEMPSSERPTEGENGRASRGATDAAPTGVPPPARTPAVFANSSSAAVLAAAASKPY